MSDRVIIFLLDRAELLFCERKGWSPFVNFPRVTSVARFVVRCLRFSCETTFTLLAYRAGHLRTVHVSQLHLSVISLLNLYPDSDFIITDIVNKNLHSVHRSLDPQLRTDFATPVPHAANLLQYRAFQPFAFGLLQGPTFSAPME